MGGMILGSVLPGVLTDYLFRNPAKIGSSIAITMVGAGILMLIILSWTMRAYRIHNSRCNPNRLLSPYLKNETMNRPAGTFLQSLRPYLANDRSRSRRNGSSHVQP
jgi:hypothetical protein